MGVVSACGRVRLRRISKAIGVTAAIVALVVATATGPVGAATTAPSCGGEVVMKAATTPWRCTFDDEFNSTSLGPAWVPQLTATSGYTSGPEGNQACYEADGGNVSVSGGHLNLTVRQAATPFTCLSPAGNFTTRYTAGMVSTYQHFSQDQGRFEVRAKLPSVTVRGLQETLWLWPDSPSKYGSWPGSGEIDLAEFYSQYPRADIPYLHYIYNPKTVAPATSANTTTVAVAPATDTTAPCALTLGTFNTYTVQWVVGRITISVNGHTCLLDNYRASNTADPGAPFNQPFMIALTQALGIGTNAFTPSNTPLPATTEIDYVRVWH